MPDYNWIPKNSFEETNWVRLGEIARGDGQAESGRNELCRAYWYPLYAYVRKKGHSPEDAQELTQEFLGRLIQGSHFGELSPAKGKFRSFLLAAMNNFLANEWRHEQAKKRGGGTLTFSIDADAAETQFIREPSHNQSPSRCYELQWARTLMDNALAGLRAEYQKENKLPLFEELQAIVEDDQEDKNLATTAMRVGVTPATFRKALQRFRVQYQERLQAEVHLTVSLAKQVDAETRFIRKVLRG